MYITAQGCRLRNDLYCVEWDVKLYYTIPYICKRNIVGLGYSTWVRSVVSTNIMQFNEFEYHFAWCINMNDGKRELNNWSVLCVSEDLLKVQYPHFFTQAPPNIYLWLYNYLCKQQCAAFPCIPSVTLRLERVIMVKCAFLTQLIIILMHSFITLLFHSPNGDVMWQS